MGPNETEKLLHSIFSRFIHVVEYISTLYSFLLSNSIPLYECTTFCLSTRWLADIWVVATFVYYE